MSATNRGAERVPQDSYPTPGWAVRRFLEAIELPRGSWLEPCAGSGVIVREIAEYADEIHAIEIAREYEKPLRAALAGSSRTRPAPLIGDYLLAVTAKNYDVIITNPPFSLAFEFAQKAVREADHVALLLRLNFLGSGTKSGRTPWLRQNPPDVYVLPNRPSFAASIRCVSKIMLTTGEHAGSTCPWRVTQPIEDERPKRCPWCDGKVQCSTTDATEYAWFVWHTRHLADPRQLALRVDRGVGYGKIQILADTPSEDRDGSSE
jgi:hypothetical protein